MTIDNFLFNTDSYKLTHWKQYPEGTEKVYSYFESRPGAEYDFTLFFGLQYLLENYLAGYVVNSKDVREANELVDIHVGPGIFNREGWDHIVDDHAGKLPLKIKAIPEGTCVPIGNVLMTVENTCDQCFWLTNYVESLLTHVWYPSTVATVSKDLKNFFQGRLVRDGSDLEVVNFMLHDFGYRGVSSNESAAIGGAGHLVNFMGTDTVPAMALLLDYYGAKVESLAFSVPASEHSVMTALGRSGEYDQLDRLLGAYPTGILSVVADSYNIYEFVDEVCERKDEILARDGRFVVRPDSITEKHQTPAELVVWILNSLYETFGGRKEAPPVSSWSDDNSSGQVQSFGDVKVLDDHIRVLWGDGIDPDGIKQIVKTARQAGYAAENLVFGMGGGLLQKVNRDTQRFAFKSSAQMRNGEWHDVFKKPLDESKSSKRGRLKLVQDGIDIYTTVPFDEEGRTPDILQTVFEDGEIKVRYTLDEIRSNSNA